MIAPAPYRPDRDVVSTIREDGSRRFLFPADAPGKFRLARRVTALGLIVLYLGLPWIKLGGYPAVFLDVANRRFHLFGLTLVAQDLGLLFFLISGVGFTLFFVTALFGRIWCGWACPQTVFLDHVYRVVERWIDGDAIQRQQLDRAPWHAGKVFRRVAKQSIFVLISAVLAHLFLAYYVSLPAVWGMMRDAPGRNWGAFAFIAAATGVVYFNFAWFREQLCVILCPYGRIQSALTDDHTLVIGYDAARGEPRGKAETPGAGDCIACDRCVRVCPTGIDIRQGLQMECIGCAACVDACDAVMVKLGRAPGLVRYDSLAGLRGRPTRWIRPRTLFYAVMLVAGTIAALWVGSGVKPAFLSVTRMVGAPYYVDSGVVRNQFLVRLINKRAVPVTLTVGVESLPPGMSVQGAVTVAVAPMGEELRPLIVEGPRSGFAGSFQFTVTARDPSHAFIMRRAMEFLGPDLSSHAPLPLHP